MQIFKFQCQSHLHVRINRIKKCKNLQIPQLKKEKNRYLNKINFYNKC